MFVEARPCFALPKLISIRLSELIKCQARAIANPHISFREDSDDEKCELSLVSRVLWLKNFARVAVRTTHILRKTFLAKFHEN